MSPPATGRRLPGRVAAVHAVGAGPGLALAVGTDLLVRVGGLLVLLALVVVVLWSLRPPPDARRSDPSEWDPSADDEDDEFELFAPGSGNLIVDTEDGRTYEAHETKAIRAAADFVERSDNATVAALKREVFASAPARHGDPDEWWAETVRPGLSELTDTSIPPAGSGEPDDATDEEIADSTDATDATDSEVPGADDATADRPFAWEGSDRFDHEVRGERTRGTLVEVREGDRTAEFFVDDDGYGGCEVDPASTMARKHGDEWVRDAKQYLREWWRATEREREYG